MALRSALQVSGARRLGYDEQTAEQEAFVVATAVTGISIPLTLEADRRIRCHGHIPLDLTLDAGEIVWARIKNGGTIIAESAIGSLTAAINNLRAVDVWTEFTSVEGVMTLTMEVEPSDGSVSITYIPGGRKTFLTVDDMGPA